MILTWWFEELIANFTGAASNFSLPSSSSQYNLSAEFLQLFQPQLLYDRIVSSTVEALEHIIYACLGYLIVCLGIYKLTLAVAQRQVSGSQAVSAGNGGGIWRLLRRCLNQVRLPEKEMQRNLFVTAHPDDECMFFGPVIYSLTQRKDTQVYLLCLSTGGCRKNTYL